MDLDDSPQSDNHFILPRDHSAQLHPLFSGKTDDETNPAADIVRQKIAAIYGNEPEAKAEIAEAKAAKHRSKHEAFMYALSTSGKSLADIQTQWHNYYINLPDDEKHEVWREFYAAHGQGSHYPIAETRREAGPVSHAPHSTHADNTETLRLPKKTKSVSDIKQQILHHVNAQGRLKKRHHIQSLLFGLGMGSLVMLILLFGFFNERFIAPLITPSRNVSATSIITDLNSSAGSPNPIIIIPKINVEIPVVYDQTSIAEKDMQRALERGVVHYATTPTPGELGNAVIFGHSSNNILNKGKYKFAFVLLSRLENGDLFYLDKDGKRYVYQVYSKKVVEPTDLSVLNPQDKPATATLITCDPPGTSLRRLIVVGQQISPDPAGNKASSVSGQQPKPAILPSNSPSLWSRITNWFR